MSKKKKKHGKRNNDYAERNNKQRNDNRSVPVQQPRKSGTYKEGLYFVPLGGSEQFGVNLNVYISGGEFLAVDCGMGFADERFPGIDLLLPDPSFLEDNRENLKGLIITHAHEDHIGAVAYLWNRLQCPIYASEFTVAILKEKLHEQGLKKVPVHIVNAGETINIGRFSSKFIAVSHSIPDTCSLLIETPEGRVLHSGDWNLDPSPVVGVKTDEAAFREAGKKGILAYIGDSTNAEVPGRAGSESQIEEGLEKEIRSCKGRVAVTIFSSNIGRIVSITRAAKRCGRKVAVVGRSLHRMIGAAEECGYITNAQGFLGEDEVDSVPDGKLLLIVTGSQGEYKSALARISRGEHRAVGLGRGDTVIFSARPIPGNDRAINDVKNNLTAAGVQIITPSDTNNVIHVSGHPCRDEISDMFQWLRPQTVIPVHGERTQLEAHAALARDSQVPNVIVPKNGAVIKLAPGTPKIIDHISAGLLAVDMKRIISSDHGSIVERRKLQFTGAVHVSLVLDAQGQLASDPRIDTVGLIDDQMKGETKIEDRLMEEVIDILHDMSRDDLADDHFVEEELRIGIRRFVVHALGFKPKTTVHVLRI